jgi:drug/metabolite transporter (DMT)-like permease
MKKSCSYGSLIFITILWGISFPIMAQTLDYLPPYLFVAIRYLMSAFLMTIFFWKKIIKTDFHHVRSAILIGLPFALAVIGQLVGLNFTSTTNAAFLTGLTVIVVPIIIWLIDHEVPTRSTTLGIVISLIGVAIMTLNGHMKINLGDIIVFIGTIGFSIQIYVLGKLGDKLDSVILTTLQFYIVGLSALPLSLMFESYKYVMNFKLIFNLLFIILICTIFALTIQNRVQSFIPSSHVGIIFLLEPVVAMITAFLMGDIITLSQLLGSIIIIISMFIIILPSFEKKPKKLELME